MKDIFITASLVIFACCLLSFLFSAFGGFGIKRRCRCKKKADGASALGLLSGEIFVGLLFLVIAIILVNVDTGAVIMLEISAAILVLSFVWGMLIRLSPYKRRRILSFAFIKTSKQFIVIILCFSFFICKMIFIIKIMNDCYAICRLHFRYPFRG